MLVVVIHGKRLKVLEERCADIGYEVLSDPDHHDAVHPGYDTLGDIDHEHQQDDLHQSIQVAEFHVLVDCQTEQRRAGQTKHCASHDQNRDQQQTSMVRLEIIR